MSDENKPILLRQYVPLTTYRPRAYLNGFPKAGLHMLEQMVAVILSPSEVGRHASPWLGTYKWASWSMIWQEMRQYLWRLSCMERGTYLKGHSGYNEDVERMLHYGNIGHIFLYRDLRDVAVSHAHHIYDEGHPEWQHEHKDLYKMLGDFDEVLLAVIEGLGPYPGVMERWAEYAPWLDSEETLVLEYGKMRAEPDKHAAMIVLFLLQKATELLEGNGYGIDMDPEVLKELAGRMAKATEKPSTTLRRGIAGGWRDEFKPEHVEAFKQSDPDGWLVKLGFEEDGSWEI
jgi:hypothetical protein